jgi:hypothetical protein
MKNIRYILLALSLYEKKTEAASLINNPIQKINSFFSRYSIEKTDHKEFSTKSLHTISIENHNGPITITTGWKKNHLYLKTIRHVKKPKDLNDIQIVADSTKQGHLAISTLYNNSNKKNSSVEYELIAPPSVAFTIKTDTGNISINDIKEPVCATTNHGTITISNMHNSINAQTKKGNISIDNAHGSINARSYHGTISITKGCDTIFAHTTKGKISVNYEILPPTSIVGLKTDWGKITLSLPTNTNATINATTEHGTLSSDHYIMIKPYATQLNSYAWNRFKREAHGTLGTGNALISLISTYGNLKICTPDTIKSHVNLKKG